MSKNFKKFKEKARRHSIFSSLLLGIGGGATLLAVLMLVRKLAGRNPEPVLYIIGAGAAVLTSLVLYFVFMPSDKRLAARLDRLYSLDEKISTMVEFREEDGAFYRLQREDAEQKLGEKPLKAMKSRALLTGIVAFTVSLALIVGAVAIPVRAATEDPIDEFDKEWILASLDELIVMARNSYMADNLKTDTVSELEELVEFVKESSYFSEMKKEAVGTVSNINSSLNRVNTAKAIGEKFAASPDANLATLGQTMKSLSGNASKKALEDYAAALLTTDYSEIEFSASEIDSYLTSSGATVDDTLYVMFKTLVSKMQNGSMSDIEEAYDDAAKAILNEIIVQNVNASTVSTIISTLCSLFGITPDDLANEGVEVVIPDSEHQTGGSDGTTGDDKPKDDIGTGGLGTGDVIFAGDDLIYDPAKNKYVPYGELLNEYFAKVNEKITDGRISEETAKLMEKYFGQLFGSYDNDSK